MAGIEGEYELPEGAEDDVWSLTERERQALGISPLPRNLDEAVRLMEKSDWSRRPSASTCSTSSCATSGPSSGVPPPGHADGTDADVARALSSGQERQRGRQIGAESGGVHRPGRHRLRPALPAGGQAQKGERVGLDHVRWGAAGVGRAGSPIAHCTAAYGRIRTSTDRPGYRAGKIAARSGCSGQAARCNGIGSTSGSERFRSSAYPISSMIWSR